MNIPPEQWATVSALLDEALDLPPQERPTWLGGLGPEHATLVPLLQRFLEQASRLQQTDFAATLPGRFTGESVEDSDGPATLNPGDQIGPYRLVRPLGSGGMGAVWLAERSDGLISRPVALKLPHLFEERHNLVRRFARERQILAALTHPNIARLYDAGVSEQGRPYLALEYVEGKSITAWCDERQLGARERLALFLQVLEAVRHAHANLVIHRDLKPSNLMVNATGQVQLLDFGIAKLLQSEERGPSDQTALTALAGLALTPQYAAPEQILGKPIGTAADIYSLGVVLYELLTGALPYRLKHSTRIALEQAIVTTEATRPSAAPFSAQGAAARSATPQRLARLLRGDLDTIVLKALQKDPTQRYLSVESLAQDLSNYLQGRAVLARPDSAWYRTRKFLRRNWLPATAGAIAVTSLALGLGLAIWQAKISRDQATLAREEARTTKAVENFLVNIFRANSNDQPDPLKARLTTARELLDIGAAKIESDLKDAPAAEAEVLEVVSDMYEELGLKERAVQLAEERVALLRTLHGPDDPILAEPLAAVSAKLQMTDRSSERASYLREALRILENHPGNDPRPRIQALRQLAIFESDSGDRNAISHARQAVVASEAAAAPVELVLSSLVMGNIQSTWGDDAGAEATLGKALEMAATEPKVSRRQLILLLAYLGDAQRSLGKISQAEANFREGLDRAVKISGENHLDVAQMEFRLSRLLFDSGRTREGLRLIENARARVIRVRGATDRNFLPRVLAAESSMRTRYGDPESAMLLIDDALRLLDVRLRDRSQEWPPLQKADIALDLGRTSEAAFALDRFDAEEGAGRLHSADSRDYRKLLAARYLVATRRTEAARALALAGIATAGTPNPSLESWSRLLQWAELVLDTGDPQAALTVANDSLARIQASLVRDHLAGPEQRASVIAGKALVALGQPAAGEALLRHSMELAERIYDPQRSAKLADVQIALADCLLDQDRIEDARVLAARARAIHAAHKELGLHFRQPLRLLEARLRGASGQTPKNALRGAGATDSTHS